MDLEKAKLELEVERLKNPPEAISERRGIYEQLRGLVREVLISKEVTAQQVLALQAVRHDATFCFPLELCKRLDELILNVITAQVTEAQLGLGPTLVGNERWPKLVDKSGLARIEIAGFESEMVELFRPYLQRAA